MMVGPVKPWMTTRETRASKKIEYAQLELVKAMGAFRRRNNVKQNRS